MESVSYEQAAAIRLHCLSAFTAFPTDVSISTWAWWSGLHCLSAFTAFPTKNCTLPLTLVDIGSPLPFGVHCFPDLAGSGHLRPASGGLHCLSAFTAFPTSQFADWLIARADKVSIAFRRSLLSRHRTRRPLQSWRYHVSIAFRRSLLSRLTSFITTLNFVIFVSIAFRRSLLSRRIIFQWS